MFYPSELLQRSGPLAHVWLAANAEKKLTKQQVLQDKIEQDINEIMRPQAPFSLRLSGSLMFGVVRIYSRKARYLLDDCTDALWRIKMAFKPGNIDLPANSHVANPAALMLADAITDIDLLAPMPDPSLLLSQSLDLQNLGLPSLGADWEMDSSQFLSGSIEQPRRAEPEILDDTDDLGLDLGEDFDVPPPLSPDEGISIEQGRNAPAARPFDEEFETGLGGKGTELEEGDDLELDLGDDLTEIPGRPDITITDTDVPMGGMTELGDFGEEVIPEDEPIRERSASPLSELGEEEERALEQEVSVFQPAAEQEEEEEQHQARAKRRRVIQQDTQTQLSTTEIREQQNNREDILKPASFLPRDPLLMALMNMQKSGGFVSSILRDGRSQGWAPELRGILSLEVVSRPAQKRKRDSGVAATADEARASIEPTPQLEFEEDQLIIEEGDGLGGDTSIREDEEHIQLPEDEPGFIPQEEEEEVFSPIPDNFDDTTAPILHPADSGVVSLETKHAVHLLRQVFGDAAETSEEERRNTAVSFQGMFPETTTAKPDIARMFNEILVLGTKDAIKVEQQTTDNELGGPIRIRAKRGLWGSWAETDVSGAEAIKSAAAAEAGPSIRDDTQTTATSAAPIPSAEIAVGA
ncbi:sister chromatid cohesion protein 1 [Paraconiothyrium brasiliense]|uniref:Sister chromatid cohesion protein 1 n=1 Tax=Paraconiothyrium brasiliense TaxID=300254 RepID=A0ABR3QYK3_9PLEO